MISDDKISADLLNEYKYDFTDEELENINKFSVKKFINNKIVFKELDETIRKKVIKEKINNAISINDIKNVLKDLLN